MYAYAKKYDAEEVWLLYPVNEEMKDAAQIEFRSELADNVVVSLYFVDVTNVEQSLMGLREKMKSNEIT